MTRPGRRRVGLARGESDGPGYGFVPLPPAIRRVEREHARWDRRAADTFSGTLELELTTEQPLHVGTGAMHARDGTVVLRAARVRERPGLPGSSRKGVLRARYEAITRSCAGGLQPAHDHRYEVRSSSRRDITRAKLAPSASAALPAACPDARGERREVPVCPACSLFGRMSARGRVTVTDLACAEGVHFVDARMPERFAPNLHHIGAVSIVGSVERQRFEVTSLYGRKLWVGRGPASETRLVVEAIPRDAVIAGQLRLHNATPAELGGVLAALGVEPAGAMKVGGGKGHGFGRVRARIVGVAGRAVERGEVEAWRWAFLQSEDRWGEGEDALVAMLRGDR